MGISLVHLYAGYAMCCDGEKTIRVNLTDEQIVQLASEACELAAKILRWGVSCANEKSSTANPSSTPRKK